MHAAKWKKQYRVRSTNLGVMNSFTFMSNDTIDHFIPTDISYHDTLYMYALQFLKQWGAV